MAADVRDSQSTSVLACPACPECGHALRWLPCPDWPADLIVDGNGEDGELTAADLIGPGSTPEPGLWLCPACWGLEGE